MQHGVQGDPATGLISVARNTAPSLLYRSSPEWTLGCQPRDHEFKSRMERCGLAERLGTGLQLQLGRFDSGIHVHFRGRYSGEEESPGLANLDET